MRLQRLLARPRAAPGADERPRSVEQVAADAEQLIESGDLVAAIDRLASVSSTSADPALPGRLLRLRHEAAISAEPGPGRLPWPPEYADPFPEVAGRPPEITSDELGTDVLAGAVAHHGCLVVRGAFSDEQVQRTIENSDRARARQGTGTEDRWYQPLVTEPVTKNNALRSIVEKRGGVWLGDSPACTEQVLADLASSGVVAAIAGHFGERPFFSLQKSTLRRSQPDHQLVAWHQDGSFLTSGVRTMNASVALSRCGGDHPAPALELIPRRIPDVLPVDGRLSPHSISFDLIGELAAVTPTIVPAFDPGDAILFDERFVHRTHLTEAMTEVRYALECWFFAPSHHSAKYTPLLV